jgi:hypothetical protein
MSHSKKPSGTPAPGAAKGQLSDADARNVKGGATSTTTPSTSPVLKPVVPPSIRKGIDPCW